jgi:hypothetical protein
MLMLICCERKILFHGCLILADKLKRTELWRLHFTLTELLSWHVFGSEFMSYCLGMCLVLSSSGMG